MASSSAATEGVEDLDWEEWDASLSPLSFFDHCLAGSFAGVMEHTLLYPLDTVKTCWQSQVLNKAASVVVVVMWRGVASWGVAIAAG
jgi:solute carrier family 25 iron transporter 28/37